ncbi:hypothetical protein [Limnohabitans sp.]|jgi:hypothetical protein|uniref:hypothetical protein n=1 Tax=Limnohabitans sp. TaxID=1907725 RepID=UPI0037C07E3B
MVDLLVDLGAGENTIALYYRVRIDINLHINLNRVAVQLHQLAAGGGFAFAH